MCTIRREKGQSKDHGEEEGGRAARHHTPTTPKGPPAALPPPPPPRDLTSAPFLDGKGALSYGPGGQLEYGPPGLFQSTVSLNLDSVRDRRDAFFADLHELKASVLLFQDHRLRDAGARRFVIEAAEKVFRVKKGRFCAVVSDPLATQNGQ